MSKTDNFLPVGNRILAGMFITGVLLMFIPCMINLIQKYTSESKEWISGESQFINGRWWDFWYFPDSDMFHYLRIMPEGVSVKVQGFDDVTEAQLDLTPIPTIEKEFAPLNFISG